MNKALAESLSSEIYRFVEEVETFYLTMKYIEVCGCHVTKGEKFQEA